MYTATSPHRWSCVDGQPRSIASMIAFIEHIWKSRTRNHGMIGIAKSARRSSAGHSLRRTSSAPAPCCTSVSRTRQSGLRVWMACVTSRKQLADRK
jgi:hypothetical protein